MNGAGKRLPCPRCGTRMEYWVEIELGSNGSRRIKYYYKCPRCGYRVNDIVIVVRRENGRLVIEREEHMRRLSVKVGNVRRR